MKGTRETPTSIANEDEVAYAREPVLSRGRKRGSTERHTQLAGSNSTLAVHRGLLEDYGGEVVPSGTAFTVMLSRIGSGR